MSAAIRGCLKTNSGSSCYQTTRADGSRSGAGTGPEARRVEPCLNTHHAWSSSSAVLAAWQPPRHSTERQLTSFSSTEESSRVSTAALSGRDLRPVVGTDRLVASSITPEGGDMISEKD